jgi:uncharacterized protein YjiS (DUF1127 family)
MRSSTLTVRTEFQGVTCRAGLMLRLMARLQLWRQNSRTRRQLAQLDGRQLADAGISPSERDAELDKPFWR